jgi:hypothetical protein
MNTADLALIDNDLPLPNLSGDARFDGPNGVEMWLAAFIAHAARIEYKKNKQAEITDPTHTPTSRFYVTPKADEYSAENGVVPIRIEYAVEWKTDFSGVGLVTIPPPTIPAPEITGFSPASVEIGQQVTITGHYFQNLNVVFQVGGVLAATIVSSTSTQIVCTFPEAATAQITVSTASGDVTTVDNLQVD